MRQTFKDLTRTLGALMLALFMVAGLAACTTDTADEPEEDEVAETTDTTATTTEDDDDLGLDATMAIDDVSTGTELAEDGSIELANNEDDFNPGDTVYVAMEVGDATAGSTVELVWYGPDGMEASSSSKTVEDDMHYLNFEVDTSGWPAGEYRGEVWYDNELVNEFEINLGDDDGEADDAEDEADAA